MTAVAASPKDFAVRSEIAVLHYYGSGGWGIQWGDTYLLTAPYFSNHNLASLIASQAIPLFKLRPNLREIRAGVAGTPIASTQLLLIGHGHVDHVGDVPALFSEGLIHTRPTLIADRSTTNELAFLSPRFGCIAAIDASTAEGAERACPLKNVRITPLHHEHAPNVELVGQDVRVFGGAVQEPMKTLPQNSGDFRLGDTWAYLIDLLDERGKVAFRIHYVDAAAGPPHGFAPDALLKEREVDVHIGCVPGFEQSVHYPEAIIRHHHVRYLLMGHWEDFLQPRGAPLMPLRSVLDQKALERFVQIVEREIPRARSVAPLNKTPADCAAHGCGPRGAAWALPVPGETFQFQAGPQNPRSE